MDSITQIALGISVSETVMQNKVGRKASLWGAICGTLPDLDVFIPFGNVIKEFTYHRAESHAFFYMAIAAPILAWLITKIHPGTKPHRIRWVVAVYLTFVTHVLIDGLTAYGTQMLLPFSNNPVAWNTIFIVDPLYTVPLLVGILLMFFARKSPALKLRFNTIGLIVSSLYLVWTMGAKAHVESVTERSLENQGITATQTMSGPTPFNTLLWRVVAMTEEGYSEGFYSLLDSSKEIRFELFPSEPELLDPLADTWNVQRLQWFTRGFYAVTALEDKVVFTDIRMGVGGLYFFNFAVGEIDNEAITAIEAEQLTPESFDGADALGWTWRRIWNEEIELQP